MLAGMIALMPLSGQAKSLSDIMDTWKLSNLPYLNDDQFSLQGSSRAKTNSKAPDKWWTSSAACNVDWYEPGKYDNVLYYENGEAVLFEEQGPGVINRIWITYSADDPNANIKFYFDGEAEPRINMPIEEMFQNIHSPFLRPLCVDRTRSSGGYISYVPLVFNESVKISIDKNISGKIYYNIGYQRFPANEEVETYTGNEDLSDLLNLFNSLGQDPKEVNGAETISGDFNIEGEQSKTIADISGSKVINAIEITGDGDLQPTTESVRDKGKAFKGYSTFTMNINPSNTGVRLVRRMDYHIADQKAKVYVDGALVGEWLTEGETASGTFRNVAFDLPKSFTAGKSSIDIKVEFVDSELDWNEFTYWTYCDGVETDMLDIGETASEVSHNYVVNQQVWSGERSYQDLTDNYPITDEGRAFKGYSQFVMKVSPDHEQITLRRRLDYTIANQKAKVYVDGVEVGEWLTSGELDQQYLHSSFQLPLSATQGKSELTLKVEFMSAEIDWNEFTYWILSDGVVTDELDVGNADSEEGHQYLINNANWQGTRTYSLYKPEVGNYLNDTMIKIYWNGESEPSVNAPLGAFFGTGMLGNGEVKALPLGITDGRMYMYFPMPFKESARVVLESTTMNNKANLSYTVQYADFTDSFEDVGYFKTQYRELETTTKGQDVLLLSEEGRGKVLGIVQTGTVKQFYRHWGWFQEGDERIYIDQRKTPALYGTGTEDFYNGGWYYKFGTFTNAFSGCTLKDFSGPSKVSAYRLFVNDALQFRDGINAYIEHGGSNDTVSQYWTLAYYYHQPEEKLVLSDTLDVGNTSSENSHNYVIEGAVGGIRTKTSAYDGTEDDVSVTENGRGFTGSSRFNMTIDPDNQGVLLRRILDYSVKNQKAKVYVDDQLVGTWYNGGDNPFVHWRQDDFFIPKVYTEGKSTISIKVEYTAHEQSSEWNEFLYETLSLK